MRAFDYATRGAGEAKEAPPPGPALAAVIARFAAAPGAPPAADQVTVNDYPPSGALPAHIDTHSAFGDSIAALSLGGGAPLEFARPECRRRSHVTLWLPPRSLLVLTGEARLAWEHRIRRGTDRARRVSITVRSLRTPPVCACPYASVCDSQGGGPGKTRDAAAKADKEEAAARDSAREAAARTAAVAAAAAGASGATTLEHGFVASVYDRIAHHFDATRVAVWPQVASFLAARGPRPLLADVGCGNGKYLGLAGRGFAVGVEPCGGLAAAAARRGGRSDVAAGDGLALPLRQGRFDGVLCIAVVHHLASRARRQSLVTALARLLAPGGAALITAWATVQPDGKDAARAARWVAVAGGERGDFLVPWHEPPGWRGRPGGGAPPPGRHRQAPPVAFRFYHCYAEGELAADALAGVSGVAGVSAGAAFLDQGNWCVELTRGGGEGNCGGGGEL